MKVNITIATTDELHYALDMIDTISDLYGYLPQPEASLQPRIIAELSHRAA